MTTKTEVLKSIRAKCIDCCVGSESEVKRCHLTHCALHKFRMGKDPTPARKGPKTPFGLRTKVEV